jgi:hypothetical protein
MRPLWIIPVENEFIPFGRAQFPRSNEHEWRESKRGMRDGMTIVAVNCAHQFANAYRVGNRGTVDYGNRGESPTEVHGGVPIGAPGRDGVANYLAHTLLRSVGSLVFSARL